MMETNITLIYARDVPARTLTLKAQCTVLYISETFSSPFFLLSNLISDLVNSNNHINLIVAFSMVLGAYDSQMKKLKYVT